MLVLEDNKALTTLKKSMINTNEYKNRNNINENIQNKIHSNLEEINKKEIVMKKISDNNIEKSYTQIKKPQRREIWMVNFGQRKGSIQSGIRPCIIGSNSVNNKYAYIRNVYPVTSKINKKLLVHVEIDESCGLSEKSLVLTEQITTIDIRYDLLYYIGIVDEVAMKRIDIAKNIQLGDLKPKNELERLSEEIRNYIVNKLKFIDVCKSSLKLLFMIKGDDYSMKLTEEEMLKEENELKYYCYNNKINYIEICNNYEELKKRKEESVAL